jgi:hypothetical protein
MCAKIAAANTSNLFVKKKSMFTFGLRYDYYS